MLISIAASQYGADIVIFYAYFKFQDPSVAWELFDRNIVEKYECFNSKTTKYQNFLKVCFSAFHQKPSVRNCFHVSHY